MNEELTPLQAMREAQDAARESLKASKSIGDEGGVIKASRAISDISARIARISPDGRELIEPLNVHLKDVYGELIKLMEDPDPKRRDQAASSLRAALAKREGV